MRLPRQILLLVTVGLLIACSSQPALSQLEQRITQLIEAAGADTAVAFRTLDGRAELLMAPDREYHAASTMKIPVMIELFRQAHEGILSLDDQLVIGNRFTSIVDGTSFELSPEDDSDPDLYEAIGESRSLRELCERMIIASSNLATNLLILKLGAAQIQNTVDGLGASGMKVRRCLEDGKAFRQGISNTTTARALLVLLERIGRGEAVDREASREMIEILSRQQFNEGIPAGLPQGVKVAHKTGQITRIHHDAGLVLSSRPYILVVLVRGIELEEQSAGLISDISRAVYSAATAK